MKILEGGGNDGDRRRERQRGREVGKEKGRESLLAGKAPSSSASAPEQLCKCRYKSGCDLGRSLEDRN
eukprot:602779-Hanusia_phi.AAC.2